MCRSRGGGGFNLKEKHRHRNSLVFTIAKGKVMQILQKIIIMKSKDLIHFLYIFLCTRTVKTHWSFSPQTRSVAPVPSWNICCNHEFVRRRIITGAEDETGTNSFLHRWKKVTMTVILQYLNIYYLSSHSVGRSTYFTPRHPLHLYAENRGKKRWVRLNRKGQSQ